MRLVERDYKIMQELSRWRFALGRHIRHLAGFVSERTTDRRLAVLMQAGYIERRKILYGVPSIYTLTAKGKTLINKSTGQNRIRIEQIMHDIAVLDTVIYYMDSQGIKTDEIITEKELHSIDGFGNRTHHPDFVFKDIQVCVEVELTLKAKNRLLKNIENNFMHYSSQRWIVPSAEHRIRSILYNSMNKYTGIEILELEEVQNYVRRIK